MKITIDINSIPDIKLLISILNFKYGTSFCFPGVAIQKSTPVEPELESESNTSADLTEIATTTLVEIIVGFAKELNDMKFPKKIAEQFGFKISETPPDKIQEVLEYARKAYQEARGTES